METLAFKTYVVNKLSILLSQSYYITQLCRAVVQRYDNDCNDDFISNGESFLLGQLQKVMINKRLVLFDIGANVGTYTQMLYKHFINSSGNAMPLRARGQIYSFDPLKSNIEKIEERSLNNVSTVECAVSNEDGSAEFFQNIDEKHSGTDSLFDMNDIGYSTNSKCINIKTIKLDTFCVENSIEYIDFMKMDIEGNELNAMRGTSVLLQSKKIGIIQFEFGHAARAIRVLLLDIIRFLGGYGYNVYTLKPQHIEKVIYTPFFENRYSMINFVAFHEDKISMMEGIINE